ncbi:uncharacterized protein VDAG_00119 [Verticillium dahliae VdLs.17]|uniref:Uncharacterized protein n=1 Tax=Verticillium dahliae (strain VdLs.17 / ATCC MYA-4575 / FGSC 10137) TaxID=498257 RepID=G2WRD6_VERDV|nr:uncharacterized protein VDAG_00119 [Verticillium dahliae VdLs.17]EGY13437.1 hypothetical protein VDAG_00119 [Verticillium dahliae VdLs.17]
MIALRNQRNKMNESLGVQDQAFLASPRSTSFLCISSARLVTRDPTQRPPRSMFGPPFTLGPTPVA